MRLTPRDVRLLRDIALSHVLSRDQILALGYFSSVTRANTRMRELSGLGLARRLSTPFFGQGLYQVTPRSGPILGERISPLVQGRTGSPRFLQHALATTNVRIQLLSRPAVTWRFEQQASCAFRFGGRTWEVRPDGLCLAEDLVTAIEVDLGHVAPAKYKEKLRAYEAFTASGEVGRSWHCATFRLLTVTTGPLRAGRLARLVPSTTFEHEVLTFDAMGVASIGCWS